MATTTCLETKVRNIYGKERFYGYLGRRGKMLADGEEFTISGDLLQRIADEPRRRTSFQNDLRQGRLALVSTPAVHLFDATTDETKVVTVDGGTLSVTDPCWGTYSSSMS